MSLEKRLEDRKKELQQIASQLESVNSQINTLNETAVKLNTQGVAVQGAIQELESLMEEDKVDKVETAEN